MRELRLLHDAVLPYFCCVTHPQATSPLQSHSLIRSLSWQTDCHGLQPTHSCSYAVIQVPIQKAFILPVIGHRAGWQTEGLHKTMWARLAYVFACACVVVATFT